MRLSLLTNLEHRVIEQKYSLLFRKEYKRKILPLLGSSAGALINIALNFALIPVWGGLGAALATGASYLSVYIYRSIDTKKYFSVSVFAIRNIAIYIAVIGGAFAVYVENIYCYVVLSALIIFTFISFRTEICNVLLFVKRKVSRKK